MASKRVRLAQQRKAAGLSQERLAELLGVDRSTVGRWEAADTDPQPYLRPKLAAALGTSLDHVRDLLNEVDKSAGVEDRMAYALGHPASTDLVGVAQLRNRILSLDESYDRSPSTGLIGAAGQAHGQVAYLRENANSAKVRRALYEVEAESSLLMGQLVWDASQRREPTGPIAYFDQAVHAAQQVRDPAAESYAILRKAYVALYGESDPRRGLALATESSEVASDYSPSLTGLALLHVAESHAMLGDLRSCEIALTGAERQFDLVGADDVAAAHYSINEFNRLAGSCYLFLNLPGRAEPILYQTACALGSKKKSQAIALANLTLSLIRQRKLDEAAGTLHQTIDAVELTRGGGALNLVFTAGRELKPWRQEPWVQDIHDRLLALMASI
ncbi:helix-turn-helix transcriptional regulator [Kribbella sp. DT2]|uniref:helix-turn-helix transcriptional regulator n=1 Tax=Kribbella sp. DT2 TaxID=3393427 RepID=UPI003CF226A4